MADADINAGMGSKKRAKKRLFMTVGLILLVVAVAGGVGVGTRWWQERHKPQSAEHVNPGEVKFSKAVTDAQKLMISGDYDKAHETINKALGAPGISAQEKHDLYMQQSIVYENQQNYDAALESSRHAGSAMESLQSAQSIANLAANKGDKEEAIAYYKKAITLIPDDPPQVRDNLKQYFENMIIYLEGGQPVYE